jgi:hypothetical protein
MKATREARRAHDSPRAKIIDAQPALANGLEHGRESAYRLLVGMLQKTGGEVAVLQIAGRPPEGLDLREVGDKVCMRADRGDNFGEPRFGAQRRAEWVN